MTVALLSYLRQFKNNVSDPDYSSRFECFQVISRYNDVFPERSVTNIDSRLLKILDHLIAQKADLTVPFPGMRVSVDAKVLNDLD